MSTVGSAGKLNEDAFHVFIECTRVKAFWEWVESRLRKLDPDLSLGVENRIFGIACVRNSVSSIIANLNIQSAQRCIWYARADYEEKDEIADLWEALRKRILTLARRARDILPRHRFDEIFVSTNLISYSGYKLELSF